jgi:hypothetical protein
MAASVEGGGMATAAELDGFGGVGRWRWLAAGLMTSEGGMWRAWTEATVHAASVRWAALQRGPWAAFNAEENGHWQVGPLLILFHNEIKLPEIELTMAKISRLGEKFPENLWGKKMYFGTTFVIATSYDSPQILNYWHDSKSNKVSPDLCSY